MSPVYIRGTVSPLTRKILNWKKWLAKHPDPDFAEFILDGIREGFRIGFRKRVELKGASQNLPSVNAHKEVVREYIEKELEAGRVKRVADQGSRIHISPFGVIPKKEQGKWRLIVDLSHPRDHSINDGVDEGASSLAYVSVDNLAETILGLGRGTLMGKCDVKSAYRNIPVYPGDAGWLGLKWDGEVFVDTALPFGLRSAPKIFTAVADAFQWILIQAGVQLIFHYIDDFAVVGRTEKECRVAMETVNSLATDLGLPMEPSKTVGPVTKMTFLGIEIDTQVMELRLPEEKLGELKKLLVSWLRKKHCIKGDLESLAGKLQQACRVVRPGRCFMRHFYAAISVARQRRALIRVNKSIRADIWWWYTFMQEWNGVSLLWNCGKQEVDEDVWTDASGPGDVVRYGPPLVQHPMVDAIAGGTAGVFPRRLNCGEGTDPSNVGGSNVGPGVGREGGAVTWQW